MELRKWQILIIFLLTISFLKLGVNFALAKTEIEQINHCAYEIKLNIVFNFADGVKDKAQSLVAFWQEGMDKIWNGDYGSKIFGGNSLVNYRFELKAMKSGETCADYPDAYCIDVVSGPVNQRGNVSDSVLTGADSQQKSGGEWTTFTTNLNAAHEAGHLLGLGDEYHYDLVGAQKQWINDNLNPNEPQSIMAQTWGQVGAFQEQTEKIIKLAGFNPPSIDLCPALKEKTEESVLNMSAVKKVEMPEAIKFYSNPSGKEIYSERVDSQKLIGAVIKGETDPAVYLVDNNGKLRWLTNEQVAKQLLGENWGSKIIWFNDAIVYTYQFGEPIEE